MALNDKLKDVVLTRLAEMHKDNPQLKMMVDGDLEGTKNVIESFGDLQVDKPYKVRFMFHSTIGYGYDFETESEGGKSPKEIYEHAVDATRQFTEAGMSHVEHLVDSGVEEERYGWYTTKFP
ncbi:hypothetical protein GOV14_01280 [Candidatus Pacearchaeota archaeon]|nr:hypothetical protein [Candidatus Pacearchaeota archaeon]